MNILFAMNLVRVHSGERPSKIRFFKGIQQFILRADSRTRRLAFLEKEWADVFRWFQKIGQQRSVIRQNFGLYAQTSLLQASWLSPR